MPIIGYAKVEDTPVGHIMATSKSSDGFYIAKVDKTGGSLANLVKIPCSSVFLPIDDLSYSPIGNNVYITGASQCFNGAFVIWFDPSSMSNYSGHSYNFSGLALRKVIGIENTLSTLFVYGHLGVDIAIYSIGISDGSMSYDFLQPQQPTDGFSLENATFDFLLACRVSDSANVLIKRKNNKAVFVGFDGSLNVVNGASYTPSSGIYVGFDTAPITGGYILAWSGSTYIAFADTNLGVRGFSEYSSYTPTTSPYTFTLGTTQTATGSYISQTFTFLTPSPPSDYSVTISTVYTYTPPGGGGGSPPENIVDVPVATIDGTNVQVRAEVPANEAKIVSSEAVPPASCPTPSTYVPVCGGLKFGIKPSTTSQGLSLKQAGRFSTTLTFSYPKELSKKAKVFACTRSGCMDISQLASIEGNKLVVRVEDGSILDEDGTINGQVKTKSLVYSVMPEKYRKSGECSMGGGADWSMFGFIAPLVLYLARRLRVLYIFLLVFLSHIPSYANMDKVKEHIREGEYEEALILLYGLIKERGLSEERSLLRSYLLLKTGNIKEAIKQTEEDLKFMPSRRLWLRLAYLYGVNGDPSKAKGILQKDKERGSEYYFVDGHLKMVEGKYTLAKYSLSKVDKSSPNYDEAQFYLAQIYSIEKDTNRFKESVSRIGRDSEFFPYGQLLSGSYERRKKLALPFPLVLTLRQR